MIRRNGKGGAWGCCEVKQLRLLEEPKQQMNRNKPRRRLGRCKRQTKLWLVYDVDIRINRTW